MHHIYETDAYILKTIPQGEADMLVTCFTKDFGLVRAYANGLRYEKSKLRFAIQDYAQATVSLVQGKYVWRLTNAQVGVALPLCMSKDACAIMVRTARLLERLLQGEEPHPSLFAVIAESFTYLQHVDESQYVKALEHLIVLRVLYHLGYIDGTKLLQPMIVTNEYTDDVVSHALLHERDVLDAINRALQESHL